MCDMTHSYVWHDLFIFATWLIHMCDMTYSYVRHDSFICVTWLIHMCDMTRSYVWHDSFICATWLIHMCDMNYLGLCAGIAACHKIAACQEIAACFPKRATNYRALLQKMTYKHKVSYWSLSPCLAARQEICCTNTHTHSCMTLCACMTL